MSPDMRALLDRPIAFHRALVPIAGGVLAALMLSQAIYWQRRTTAPDGWWWKTREEWSEEAGLTRSEQETARRLLKDSKWWQEERRGIPAKMYYRVDIDLLLVQLAGIQPTSRRGYGQPSGENPANQSTGKPPANTETTTQTTSETTTTQVGGGAVDKLLSAKLPWPQGIDDAERERCIRLIRSHPTYLQQQFLAALTDAITARRIKKTASVYLAGVIKRWRDGTFTPPTTQPLSPQQKRRPSPKSPPDPGRTGQMRRAGELGLQQLKRQFPSLRNKARQCS